MTVSQETQAAQVVECPVVPGETMPASVKEGDRLFTGSLAFVALRCTLRYVALPFVLPLIGLAGALSSVIALVIDAVALTTIALNIRRLWNTSWRWRYLGLGVVMTIVIAILAWGDIQVLLASQP